MTCLFHEWDPATRACTACGLTLKEHHDGELVPGQMVYLEPGVVFVPLPAPPLRTIPLPSETAPRVARGVDTTRWWYEHEARTTVDALKKLAAVWGPEQRAAWDRRYPEIASARMVGRPTPPQNQRFDEGSGVWAPIELPAWLRRWLLRDVRPAWLNRARDLVLRAVGAP